MISKVNRSVPIFNSEEFLPPITRWTSWGGLVLVGTIGILMTVAALVKYNVAVKASASVRPDGEMQVVQSKLEGTIKQIEVEENQDVRVNDIIARLDDGKLQTQKSQLQGSIQQNQLQLSQLEVQVRLINTQATAESNSIEGSVAAAQVEVIRNQREHSEKQLTAQADFQEASVLREAAAAELDRYQQLAEVGAVSQSQFQEKQANAQTATARQKRTQALLNPTDALIRISQQQISQQQARGQATLATLSREREALIQRQSEVRSQLIRDQKELEQVQQEIDSSVIRATTSGVVFQLSLLNPNQVVRLGDTVAQIAPSDASLVVKAKVDNQDIDQVELGQVADLRVDACPYPDYGVLKGKVTEVAPDTSNGSGAPSGSSSGDRTYTVTIAIDSPIFGTSQRQCRLQSGMEVSASIISKQETALQYLLRKLRLAADL